jgi:PKHD-type hydroxylase
MISINKNLNEEYEALLLSPVCVEKELTSEEIQRITKLTDALELSPATVDGETQKQRSCKIAWLPYDEDHVWLYGRLYEMVDLVNKDGFHFDPIDMVEQIMYCEYEESDGFNWHYDCASVPPFSSRKLAITVQLSSSDDYRGGSLEFAVTPDHTYEVSRSAGSIIIYPTYLCHRIQPIISGKRKSLVFWVGGTSFA